MCKMKKPKMPATPPVQEEQKEADEKAFNARDEEKKKAAAMLGRGASILTGANGLQDKAVTKKKNLLGE